MSAVGDARKRLAEQTAAAVPAGEHFPRCNPRCEGDEHHLQAESNVCERHHFIWTWPIEGGRGSVGVCSLCSSVTTADRDEAILTAERARFDDLVAALRGLADEFSSLCQRLCGGQGRIASARLQDRSPRPPRSAPRPAGRHPMTAALILAASSALHLLTLIRLARVTDQRDQARSALRERNAL